VEKAVASWAERDEVGVKFGTAPFVRAVVHLKRNAPGAAFVESDQAAEGGELTIEGCQYGLLPGEFDIRDEALNPTGRRAERLGRFPSSRPGFNLRLEHVREPTIGSSSIGSPCLSG
jgi:hypothetical protein